MGGMENTERRVYEQATDDLRQVRCEGLEYEPSLAGLGVGTHRVAYVYYKVQRKWLVYDGPAKAVPNPYMDVARGNLDSRIGREEWRDLPEVTEAQAAEEGKR